MGRPTGWRPAKVTRQSGGRLLAIALLVVGLLAAGVVAVVISVSGRLPMSPKWRVLHSRPHGGDREE